MLSTQRQSYDEVVKDFTARRAGGKGREATKQMEHVFTELRKVRVVGTYCQLRVSVRLYAHTGGEPPAADSPDF
eukprot:SAG11_NODE_1882_length_4128_cov_2.284438_5_plen_74_part_00